MGKCFGQLVVLNRVGSVDKYSLWNCQCDCGKQVAIRGVSLRSGNSKSCGCGRKPGIRRAFKPFFSAYNSLARIDKSRQRETMTYEEFLKFTTCKTCSYCGVTLNWEPHNNRLWNMDRVDSNLGHTIENCIPCCKICNRMKMDMPKSIFLNHLKRVVDYSGVAVKTS